MRVDQPAAEHTHADRGDGERGVEEREGLDTEAVGERRQEHEDRAGAKTEEEGHRHVPVAELIEAAALPERSGQRRRPAGATARQPPHEPGRHEGQGGGQPEERAKSELAHDRFTDERRDGGRDEARDAVDAERPAPPLGRRQVENVGIVRHEEGREADALEAAYDGEHRNRRRGGRQHRRRHDEAGAHEHEGPPAERVHPRAHERLTQDAHRVENPHDEADLDLGTAGVLDVERQEDEAVQAQEKKEVGDGRLHESLVG